MYGASGSHVLIRQRDHCIYFDGLLGIHLRLGKRWVGMRLEDPLKQPGDEIKACSKPLKKWLGFRAFLTKAPERPANI